MRSLTAQLVVPILAALLVLTTPVGTGQGVHENELLHPVLAHVHLVDGQVITDEQLASAGQAAAADVVTSQPHAGAALGAGSGAAASGLGIALGPTPPLIAALVVEDVSSGLVLSEHQLPAEFRDTPQDPPPVPFA